MKFSSVKELGFIISLVLGMLSFFSLQLIGEISGYTIGILYAAGFSVLISICQYILFFYITNNFIKKRIRLIYKNIYRTQKEVIARETNISAVEGQVKAWAEDTKSELDELREREAFRREFIGNVSHELKTPIFNIQGYLLTLLDGALYDSNINEKYLQRANKSVERMIHIVQDLEQITKLESRVIQIELQKADLVPIVKEVMELLELKAKKKNITLSFKNEPIYPIWVECDTEKIKQVLINLFVNAIKYGNDDGFVRIAFEDMDNRVQIEVKDNGVGIAEEHLPRLFERFYRVSKSRSRDDGGTGLGLSIVKHLIEAHGGLINVQSTPAVGSTFTFSLKRAK